MPQTLKVAKNGLKMACAILAENSKFYLLLKIIQNNDDFYLVHFFVKSFDRKEFQNGFIFLSGTWYNVLNKTLV